MKVRHFEYKGKVYLDTDDLLKYISKVAVNMNKHQMCELFTAISKISKLGREDEKGERGKND